MLLAFDTDVARAFFDAVRADTNRDPFTALELTVVGVVQEAADKPLIVPTVEASIVASHAAEFEHVRSRLNHAAPDQLDESEMRARADILMMLLGGEPHKSDARIVAECECCERVLNGPRVALVTGSRKRYERIEGEAFISFLEPHEALEMIRKGTP